MIVGWCYGVPLNAGARKIVVTRSEIITNLAMFSEVREVAYFGEGESGWDSGGGSVFWAAAFSQ